MYKGTLWDQEQERYDSLITEGNNPVYEGENAYSSSGKADMYNSEKGEEKKEEEHTGLEKDVVDQDKKYEKKEVSEEDIKKKAASEIHEGGQEIRADKKKDHKSIEDAINKAMKEEKEVIFVND